MAYASATPPPWIKTAGAAEAWALLLTLRQSPCMPNIITDCMGLLHAARSGPDWAARSKNNNARLWILIAGATGGSFQELRNKLTWMPAHTTARDGCARVKSDGRPLTTAEWRANQLADALAKKGACNSDFRVAADKAIKQAGSALLQSAAKLGVGTMAANAHATVQRKADGSEVTVTRRDSTQLPIAVAKARKIAREKAATTPATPGKTVVAAPAAAPLAPLTFAQQRAQRHRLELAGRRADEARITQAAAIATAATAAPQQTSAAERMAALRRRIGL